MIFITSVVLRTEVFSLPPWSLQNPNRNAYFRHACTLLVYTPRSHLNFFFKFIFQLSLTYSILVSCTFLTAAHSGNHLLLHIGRINMHCGDEVITICSLEESLPQRSITKLLMCLLRKLPSLHSFFYLQTVRHLVK